MEMMEQSGFSSQEENLLRHLVNLFRGGGRR